LEKIKEITRGRVSTYAAIALSLGRPKATRAVGNALNKNPDAPVVPCHRVVCSDGRIGGYALGVEKKIELLKSEGIEIVNGRVKDFKEKLFRF
jgi:methylated-DNA-[protein]-cysteine S-methyltransferase